MVENRRVGIKSREVYECPAALALITAHADLEDLTLERDVHHEKARLEPRWAELVYDGLWFSPLRARSTPSSPRPSAHVTGEVRMRFAAPGTAPWWAGAARSRSTTTTSRPTTRRHLPTRRRRGVRRLWGLGVATWSARQGPARDAAPMRRNGDGRS